MNPLASLTGGLSGGISPSATATGGDSSAGLDLSYNYNSPFQVGGSGRQSQEAGLTATPTGGNQTILYVVGGIAALALLGVAVVALRK